MKPSNDKISRRQFVALSFVCLLSPLIRRVPARAAEIAGFQSWLAVPIAAVPIAAVFFFLKALMRDKREGRGVSEIICDSLGPVAGKLLVLIYALWFLFFAAYILRRGADRFICTIYPNSSPGIFMAAMVIAAALAASGQLKALARTAMLLRPVLLAALLLVFVFVLPNVDFKGLWQVSEGNDEAVLKAVPSVMNPICVCFYLVFVSDQTEGPLSFRQFAPWLATALVIAELLVVSILGVFGAELASRLSNPFFVMVRDISFFGSIERVEAIVVALWVFSDFVLISALLYMASRNLRMVLGIRPSPEKPRAFDFSHGRWTAPLCSAAALVYALFMAPDSVSLRLFSYELVPLLNLVFVLVPLPLAFLIGRFRRKI